MTLTTFVANASMFRTLPPLMDDRKLLGQPSVMNSGGYEMRCPSRQSELRFLRALGVTDPLREANGY